MIWTTTEGPCIAVDCMQGWTLTGADARGCGGKCVKNQNQEWSSEREPNQGDIEIWKTSRDEITELGNMKEEMPNKVAIKDGEAVYYKFMFNDGSSVVVKYDQYKQSDSKFSLESFQEVNKGQECALKCTKPKWKGDGRCDDKNNHCGCDFDGGDCCGKSGKTSQFAYCKECVCKNPEFCSKLSQDQCQEETDSCSWGSGKCILNKMKEEEVNCSKLSKKKCKNECSWNGGKCQVKADSVPVPQDECADQGSKKKCKNQ